jgi:hypothetical protein
MKTQIETLIKQLVDNSTMFTAFDITSMLRKQNPKTNIKHMDVRDAVKQAYEDHIMPGYAKTLQRISTGVDTYVYYPYGTDAEDYDENFFSLQAPQSLIVPQIPAMPIQVGGSQAQKTTATNSSNGSKPKRSRYAWDNIPKDKFGRIRVPASAVRAAGFMPNESVMVVLDPNIITITSPTDPYGSLNGKKYSVDTYSNIRFHLKDKFPGIDKFKIELKDSKVCITSA